MEPFQKKWYYSSAINISYSIKLVLPALVPEMRYDDLEIGGAERLWRRLRGCLNMEDMKERKKIRKTLLAYCKLDKEAMVRILEKLRAF
jgi:hypothetical protein